MKQKILITIFTLSLLLLSVDSFAESQTKKSNILSLHFDLGLIKGGNTYTHTFTIQNTFGKRFKVGRVKKNCGCLDVHLSRQEILPGEKIKATMKVEVTGRPYGTWEKEATIFEDSENPRKIILRLTGSFPKDGRLFAEPNQISVGSTPQSVAIERVFQIKRRDYSPIYLESIKSSSPAISVQQSKVPPDDSHLAFVLKINPNSFKIGYFKESVLIKTHHPKYTEIKIDIKGEITSDIYAVPKRLFLGRINTQKNTTWPIKVASFSNQKFHLISSTHNLPKNFSVTSKQSNLQLRYTSGKNTKNSGFVKGLIKAIIQFDNTKKQEQIVIPVIGIWQTPQKQLQNDIRQEKCGLNYDVFTCGGKKHRET